MRGKDDRCVGRTIDGRLAILGVIDGRLRLCTHYHHEREQERNACTRGWIGGYVHGWLGGYVHG